MGVFGKFLKTLGNAKSTLKEREQRPSFTSEVIVSLPLKDVEEKVCIIQLFRSIKIMLSASRV